MRSDKKADLSLTIGMIVISVGAAILGATISYLLAKSYAYNNTLKNMKNEGYVIMEPCNATEEDILAGKTAYVNGKLITGTKEVLDTNGCTASADVIMEGKKAYINGRLVVGTLKTLETTTLIGKAAGNQTEQHVYMARNIVIPAEPNLLAENIKASITIYGVTGTYGNGAN